MLDDNLHTRICHHIGVVDPEKKNGWGKKNTGVFEIGKYKNKSPVCVAAANLNSQSSVTSVKCKPIENNLDLQLRKNSEKALSNFDTKMQGNTVAEMIGEIISLPGKVIRSTIGCNS